MGSEVSLSEVATIPNHPDVFRAKIMNEDHRKLVLEKAKHLRDSNFHSVYVSRDLTFAQRAELFQRRQSRRAEQGLSASCSHPCPNTADGQRPTPAGNSALPQPSAVITSIQGN